jgi:hypothetical protein
MKQGSTSPTLCTPSVTVTMPRAPRFEKVQLGSERPISSVASPRRHEGELANVA